MSKAKRRKKQTVRMLKWIKRYSGYWKLICEPGNEHMDISMMQFLIKILAKEKFYEIIFVLLEVHKNEEFIKSLNKTLLQELLISNWKKGEKKKILKQIITYLK